MRCILKVHAPHLKNPGAGASGDAPQVLVYDAKRTIMGFYDFSDDLQKLFAVQGHPPVIYIEAEVDPFEPDYGLQGVRPVTPELFK